jgi:hypothetical protein
VGGAGAGRSCVACRKSSLVVVYRCAWSEHDGGDRDCVGTWFGKKMIQRYMIDDEVTKRRIS